MDGLDLLSAHDVGEVRCGVASVSSDELGAVLGKFGLSGNAAALIELRRPEAVDGLARLIERGLAHDLPCVAPEAARRHAEALIAAHAVADSRFWSNGDWSRGDTWTPLTASTFDGGLLMSCGQHRYFCVWFEDED